MLRVVDLSAVPTKCACTSTAQIFVFAKEIHIIHYYV
jgi:hypothetical protein